MEEGAREGEGSTSSRPLSISLSPPCPQGTATKKIKLLLHFIIIIFRNSISEFDFAIIERAKEGGRRGRDRE